MKSERHVCVAKAWDGDDELGLAGELQVCECGRVLVERRWEKPANPIPRAEFGEWVGSYVRDKSVERLRAQGMGEAAVKEVGQWGYERAKKSALAAWDRVWGGATCPKKTSP